MAISKGVDSRIGLGMTCTNGVLAIFSLDGVGMFGVKAVEVGPIELYSDVSIKLGLSITVAL